MHRRNASFQASPPPSPLYPSQHPSSPGPPPAPPPPPPPGTPGEKVTYSNVPGRIGKLNQLVQNFFYKAAQIIIQSRIPVVPTFQRNTNVKKTNRWSKFHMELDDTDTLRNELTPFRTATFSPPSPVQPPPLILEVSLDTRELTPQQTLILVSSQTGQRHTVETPSNRWLRGSEIVLEQWYIGLVTPPKPGAPDLPVVYKKAVVLFRRVFTEARLLPVWRLKKRLGKIKLNNSLKLKVRVANGDLSPGREGGRIAISAPLVEAQKREKIADEFSFGQIDTPAGAFDISVMYRLETDFRVIDSEALLSSHFLHLDSSQNSLPGSTSSSPRPRPYLGVDQSQAYGSLSSFHTLPQPGQNLSSSPLTALRNAPYMGAGPTTPPNQITTPYSHNRSPSQTSLSRLKDNAPLPRRPSVTFMQPFKAPSVVPSPSVDIPSSPRPGSNRSSSGVARPSSLKESFTPQAFTAVEDETPPPSPSHEAGERKRYSSSFSARRERRESHSSSRLSMDIQRRRFSGISISSRPEENEQGSVSSGSYRGDEEEDVGLFLRLVESRPELRIAGSSTHNDLNKFRELRDGYGALGDSVSGSIYIPKASPPNAIARSVGSGESPHTPVVRSRLSEGVILMEENAKDTKMTESTLQDSPTPNKVEKQEREETLKVPSTATEGITGGAKPLDIPNSPSIRAWGGTTQIPHHHATSFTGRLGRQQQDQDISNQLFEDDLDSARRHSSSLGSLEGIPSDQSSFHRRKSSNESSARGPRGRPTSLRGGISSRGHTPRGSVVGEQTENTNGQGSLREKFCSAFAGEEGDEGDELLFAMSDMMGDKR